MVHWRILPNIYIKIDMYSTQSFSENEKRKKLTNPCYEPGITDQKTRQNITK